MYTLADLKEEGRFSVITHREDEQEHCLIEDDWYGFSWTDEGLSIAGSIFGTYEMRVHNPMTVLHELLMGQKYTVKQVVVELDEGIKHVLTYPTFCCK